MHPPSFAQQGPMDKSTERIVDIDVSEEMRESFLEYSYSVIYSRALPDARDGLKPVQRRIVYQMGEMGLRPDRGHVKSARVTGEVMGKLHPHGDGAIYDALVRMAQPFSLRMPLIDGHGNFGSLDDGPAAARYTEARLAPAALLLNESLDEDVVDFQANYDAQLLEPAVLPAAFPNLLVNGGSGIAVGMATNMPPHNLGEVVAALKLLLKKPDAKLSEIMKHIPGPDLPTGGVVLVADGLTEGYESGKGSFKMRARISIESVAPRRTGLVITQLPYLVGPERVIDKIREAVNSKKLTGIHNVVDLTDRDNGLKLVIELKTGVDPNSVIEALYRLTPIEENFGINNVALVEGRPQQLGLIDLLRVYLEHRITVTRRRSQSRLEKRAARLHLIEGLQLAVLNIDEVIEVIRSSDTADEAKNRLQTIFDLSDLQSEYILELRLRRLTKFSILELEQEADQLKREMDQLREILGDEERLKSVVADELSEVAKQHGTPRRTELVDGSGIVVSRKPVEVTELTDDPCSVVVTPNLKIYRTERSEEGIPLTLRSDVALVSTLGVATQVHVSDLPVGPSAAVGLDSMIEQGTVIGVSPWRQEATLALGTKNGVVKQIQFPLPDKHDVQIIALKEGDSLVGMGLTSETSSLVFVSSDGNVLVFEAASVRPQGLAAAGMAGIKLKETSAIFFGSSSREELLVTCANSSQALSDTDPGSYKATPLGNYPKKGRGSQGVRAHRFLKNEDQLYFATLASLDSSLLDGEGSAVAKIVTDEKRDGSGKGLPRVVAAAG
jgi:DNA gyrase subunit A